MANKSEFESLVEQYFSGDLSEREINRLNDILKSDPALKSEFEFQNDIVRSLKNYRKGQLKQRLNDINVPTGILGAFMHSTSAWITSSVISGMVLVGGIFTYQALATSDEDTTTMERKIDLTAASHIVAREELIPDIPVPLPFESVAQEKVDLSETGNVRAEEVTITDAAASLDVSTEREKASFAKPNVVESIESEDEPLSADLGTKPELIGGNTGSESLRLEVSVVDDQKGLNFHYRFEEERLYLYGKYNEAYEIIELHTRDEVQFYLFYKEKYHLLNTRVSKPAEMVAISDDDLIQELEAVKQK